MLSAHTVAPTLTFVSSPVHCWAAAAAMWFSLAASCYSLPLSNSGALFASPAVRSAADLMACSCQPLSIVQSEIRVIFVKQPMGNTFLFFSKDSAFHSKSWLKQG